MNPSVFREYDIRGLAEKDFDKDFALLLGKVHGTAIAERGGTRVTVGRDCRTTSDALRRSGHCRHGLRRTSRLRHRHLSQRRCSIFRCSISTSMAGFEITASHNPSEYNGFKICLGKDTLYGEQIQEIRAKMERNEFRGNTGR